MSEALTHKPFSTEAVISAYTGRLACELDEFYSILGFIVGESLYTHQLPKAAEAVKPHLEQQFPWLAEIELPEEEDREVEEFLSAVEAVVEERSGTLIVKAAPGLWTPGQVLEDLAEMMGEKPVTIVVTGDGCE